MGNRMKARSRVYGPCIGFYSLLVARRIRTNLQEMGTNFWLRAHIGSRDRRNGKERGNYYYYYYYYYYYDAIGAMAQASYIPPYKPYNGIPVQSRL